MAYVADVSSSRTEDATAGGHGSNGERARDCVREVRAQLDTVAEELRRVASLSIAARPPVPTVVTGIGGSEGPARLFATAATTSAAPVRFVPLSSFVTTRPRAERLVVFSQGLSPNARLALARRADFGETLLIGAVDPETEPDLERRALARSLRDAGVVGITHGPPSESGMLVRLVGPTVASSVALRVASALGGAPFDADRAARAYASIGQAGVEPVRRAHADGFAESDDVRVAPLDSASIPLGAPLAFVATGALTDALLGLRWKWLETFGADPHVFDALACAHGPLQALYERPSTWLAFESPSSEALVARLSRVLPSHHTLRRLRVADDPAIGFFEATAHLDAHLLATLTAHPRDLRCWPGRGADAPLYDLGS